MSTITIQSAMILNINLDHDHGDTSSFLKVASTKSVKVCKRKKKTRKKDCVVDKKIVVWRHLNSSEVQNLYLDSCNDSNRC